MAMNEMNEKERGKCDVPSEEMFKREHTVMGLFIENAKTYVQLSSGALLLSVAFLRDFAAVSEKGPLTADGWLIASWVLFLVSIGSGALYQYEAVKFLEKKSGVKRTHGNWIEYFVDRPWPLYGVMLVGFYAGGICFTVAAIYRLCHLQTG